VLLRFYRNTEKLREMEQEFVASISHELRTPIAVLQSTSENLKKGVVTDASRLARYGTIIHREVKRLSRTLEGILIYSGLEKRSWNGLQSTSVDLGQLVGDVVESLREPAEEVDAGITVHQNIPDHRIIADATGLRLILENLIVNAIRHGLPEADKTDAPREIRLYVKSQRLGRELSIKVEDNGCGISTKEAKTIFDPFVRGEASVSAQRPGSGLGLHLVKQVVKILGGTISLESPYLDLMGKEQSGCRFVVLVPIQQEETGERKGTDH
jgi:two-component system phosphate regulon sensor histidine kinase PhoR